MDHSKRATTNKPANNNSSDSDGFPHSSNCGGFPNDDEELDPPSSQNPYKKVMSRNDDQQQGDKGESNKQQDLEAHAPHKRKATKRKAVIHDPDSSVPDPDSSDDEERLFQELAKMDQVKQEEAKRTTQEKAAADRADPDKARKGKTQSGAHGGLSAAAGAPTTTNKAKKTKAGAPVFQPAINQLVRARWMMGKKDQVPRNGGRKLVGKWFLAVVMEVDKVNQHAKVQYCVDKMIETEVLFAHMKAEA